ncbi:unnamed protein product [Blepharisma stoltei]|uniref:Uncharacterized protein n=1 Tax=Blepharisma stoltei TaxID=1481888 RepID=A0AAU9K399_9CILI|nr:unnamed protein product [Blepharisma stoltei]
MKIPEERIGSIDQEHEFLRDNDFIHKGYRLYFRSPKRILKSLFMIHNESVNVWTHLIGVILFIMFIYYTVTWFGISSSITNPHIIEDLKSTILSSYQVSVSTIHEIGSIAYKYEQSFQDKLIDLLHEAHSYGERLEHKITDIYADLQALNGTEKFYPLKEKLARLVKVIDSKELDWIDIYNPYPEYAIRHHLSRWPVVIFLVSAIMCLGCSTIFHLWKDYSHEACRTLARLDYAGISFLIAGSFYPAIYYPFYCHEKYIIMYLTGMTIASLIVFAVSMMPKFQKAELRWFRGTIFLVLGLLGVIPAVHLVYFEESHYFLTAFACYLMMAASYIVGVLIYIARVPERLYPGKFDNFGNSHNIWHCFVVAAAIWHYIGSLQAYHIRANMQMCPS